MFHLAFSTPNHQQQSVVQATTTLVGTTTPTHHVPKPLDINEASQGWINYHHIHKIMCTQLKCKKPEITNRVSIQSSWIQFCHLDVCRCFLEPRLDHLMHFQSQWPHHLPRIYMMNIEMSHRRHLWTVPSRLKFKIASYNISLKYQPIKAYFKQYGRMIPTSENW